MISITELMMNRNRRFHKNTKPRVPPSTDPYQSILNLNDDCFYELLTYLPLQDLYSISVTCNRINEIAKRGYSRFANLDGKHFLTKNRPNLTTVRKMGLIIKEIAQAVKTFQISKKIEVDNAMPRCEELIRLILLHCHNITDLKIEFGIEDRFAQELVTFENFQNLKTLKVHGNIRLNNMSRLQNLNFVCHVNKNLADLLTWNNLESLTLWFRDEHWGNLLPQICDNNPNMKRIKIFHLNEVMINVIIDKLLYLEEIIVYQSYKLGPSIMRISEIKSLKTFGMLDDQAPELLANLVKLDQLESLSYRCSTPDEMVLITKFTKLKYLRVSNFNDTQMNSLKSQRTLEHVNFDWSDDNITNEGIVTFVKGATKLKYLSLCSCFGCDENIFQMLTNLIKSGCRKSKLTVNCDFIYGWQLKDYPWLNIIMRPYRRDVYD